MGLSTRSGSTSSSSKMRAPDAIERCSWVYCIVRLRMGSKNRCMYIMNATSTPICSSLPVTIREPKYIASTIATAVSMSTAGSRLADSLPAHRLALRCSVFFSSKSSRLRFWRLSA